MLCAVQHSMACCIVVWLHDLALRRRWQGRSRDEAAASEVFIVTSITVIVIVTTTTIIATITTSTITFIIVMIAQVASQVA